MKIIIKATDAQKQELQEQNFVRPEIEFVNDFRNLEADFYFDLSFDEKNPNFEINSNPVFVNAVSTTLKDLPENYIRLNAWNGFLKRREWEIAARKNHYAAVTECMEFLGLQFQFCPDIPGLIAARVIATIINEAYYTLNENISTKEAIDTAMKLGTNYPYGPFEWANKIGLAKVELLLQSMLKEDQRYEISELLIQEAKER